MLPDLFTSVSDELAVINPVSFVRSETLAGPVIVSAPVPVLTLVEILLAPKICIVESVDT